jgi:very-short-patch-repair endonuclease
MSLPEALVVLDGAARLLVEGFVSRPRRSDYANPRLAMAAREKFSTACDKPSLSRAVTWADPRRESAAESLSAGHLLLAGIPAPDYQTRLVTPAGTFYPDFFWDGPRVIGEVDGAVKYQAADAFVAEKQREQVLRDMGFVVVRWLALEIMLTPHVVVERVSRALGL